MSNSEHPTAKPHSIKGRGTAENQGSRYIALRTEAVDDGWSFPSTLVEPEFEQSLKTEAFADRTQTLISQNRSPDINFSQSINPYKGCEHGCIYCFARPTHAYLDLSPGLDFETKLFYKTNVREHLINELGKPGYVCSTIAMGTNTDPYQPLEKQLRITREVLEVMLEAQHPVSIVTKSKLILRDLDLLQQLAALELVHVHVSVTTLDNSLKTKLEPRTAGPAARLRTIETLQQAGVPTGAMVAPVIPFINDAELETIVGACAKAGARHVGYILLRLPLEVRPLFEQWLDTHFPLKARRVMEAIKDTRGGKAYNAQWHKRMVGEGQMAKLIHARFKLAARKHHVDAARPGSHRAQLRTDLFTPLRQPGDTQMDLF